jgi:hypothetical protein
MQFNGQGGHVLRRVYFRPNEPGQVGGPTSSGSGLVSDLARPAPGVGGGQGCDPRERRQSWDHCGRVRDWIRERRLLQPALYNAGCDELRERRQRQQRRQPAVFGDQSSRESFSQQDSSGCIQQFAQQFVTLPVCNVTTGGI